MKKSLVYYLSQIKKIYPEVEDITNAEYQLINAEINAQQAAGEEVTAHQKLYSKTYCFLKWFANFYTNNGFDAKYFADYLSSFQLRILEAINNKAASGTWFANFASYKTRIHYELEKFIEKISKKTELENQYAETQRVKNSIPVQDLLNDEFIKEKYQTLLDDVSWRELKNLLNSAITALTTRQQDIVKLYFGLEEQPKSLSEIGAKYGLSKEAIRLILQKALKGLRWNPENFIKLRDYIY